MNQMNHKGQVLVLFILLLPLFFILLALLYDGGRLFLEKRKLDQIVYQAVEYATTQENENLENQVKQLIYKNDETLDSLTVNIDNDMIAVETSKKYHTIFSKVFVKQYTLHSKYVANKINENYIIRKE